MEHHEHLHGAGGLIELVLEEVDGRDARCHAILRWCLIEPREVGQAVGCLGEHLTLDEDLSGESEGTDVIGLDHRDVFERGQGAVGVALLAQHACLLPVELGDLGRVVGVFEADGDEAEEPLAVFSLTHASEELVERDRTPGITLEARLVSRLRCLLVAEGEPQVRGFFPKGRAA